MRIVHSWLADLVAVGDDAAAVADVITNLGLAVEEVGYINSHGTGTPLNDVAEGAAIRRWAGGCCGCSSS